MGNTLGLAFPSFFINEKETEINYKKSVFNYLLFEGIITLVLCFPSMIFFSSKPENPPR